MGQVLLRAVSFACLLEVISMVFAAQVSFTPLPFARERTGPRYTVPSFAEGQILYQQSVYRSAGHDFFVQITLGEGAHFDGSGGTGALLYTGNAGGGVAISPLVTPSSEGDYLQWLVVVTNGFGDLGSGPPQFWIDLRGVTIDCGTILTEGGSVSATVSSRSSSTGIPFEQNSNFTFAFGTRGVWTDQEITPTKAQISIGSGRKNFVSYSPDTAVHDRGALIPPIDVGRILIDVAGTPTWRTIWNADGSPFELSAADTFQLTFSSDFSGISRIAFHTWVLELTDLDRASAQLTMAIPGDLFQDTSPGPNGFSLAFEVDGVTVLRPRVLTVSTSLYLEAEDAEFVIHDFSLVTDWYHFGVLAIPELHLDKVRFAKEAAGPIYTLPGCLVGFKQGLYRPSGLDFILRARLEDGARFVAGGPSAQLYYLHSPDDRNGGGEVEIVPVVTAAAGQNYVEWRVIVRRGFTDTGTGTPLWSISFPGVQVNAGQVLRQGGAVRVSVQTRDALTGVPLESNVAGEWLTGVSGVSMEGVQPGTATIDLRSDGRLLRASPPDTGTIDKGAVLGPIWLGRLRPHRDPDPSNCIYGADGLPFRLADSDEVQLTFSSNLGQIAAIILDNTVSRPLTDAERASAAVVVSVPGNVINSWAGREVPVWFELTGNARIETRPILVSAHLHNGPQTLELLSSRRIATWMIDGTVLTAPWTNGNSQSWATDVHLLNLDGLSTSVTVRVLSMPGLGGISQELGRVNLGVIVAHGTMSFNLAEIVLSTLGLSPYLPDGGNLAIELTVPGVRARGEAMVWSPAWSFGAYPLAFNPASILE
ncbi:MAG: hypothetical protein EHM61_16660 [Acidobacteria bacterium]|nr:MAG: hypothetical protein EHM61_16660 [Acidobacteriota bacterium]